MKFLKRFLCAALIFGLCLALTPAVNARAEVLCTSDSDYYLVRSGYQTENQYTNDWYYDQETNTYTILNMYGYDYDDGMGGWGNSAEHIIFGDKVDEIKERYSGYKDLKDVVLGKQVKKIRSECFLECSALESISVNSSINTIGEKAFMNCSSLKEFFMPDTVKKMGPNVFEGCSSLTEIKLPSKLTEVPFYSFWGCSSLEKVTIPASIKTIRGGAFFGCNALKEVVYYGTKEQWDAIVIEERNEPLLKAQVTFETEPLTKPVIYGELFENIYGNSGYTTHNIITGNYPYAGAVSWSPVPGATKYEVYKKTDNEDWKLVSTAQACIYFDRDIMELTSTKYRVRAYINGRAQWSGYSNTLTFKPGFPYINVEQGVSHNKYVAWALHKRLLSDYRVTYREYFPGSMYATHGTGWYILCDPLEDCTRLSAMTYLWRMCGHPNGGLRAPFTDIPAGDSGTGNQVVNWAYNEGYIKGTTATTFSPDATITRGQVATILYKMAGKPKVGNVTNPFTDVKPTDGYYKAIMWAVEKGITKGTSATTFSPKQTCKTYQMLIFMYRFNDLYKVMK